MRGATPRDEYALALRLHLQGHAAQSATLHRRIGGAQHGRCVDSLAGRLSDAQVVYSSVQSRVAPAAVPPSPKSGGSNTSSTQGAAAAQAPCPASQQQGQDQGQGGVPQAVADEGVESGASSRSATRSNSFTERMAQQMAGLQVCMDGYGNVVDFTPGRSANAWQGSVSAPWGRTDASRALALKGRANGCGWVSGMCGAWAEF